MGGVRIFQRETIGIWNGHRLVYPSVIHPNSKCPTTQGLPVWICWVSIEMKRAIDGGG